MGFLGLFSVKLSSEFLNREVKVSELGEKYVEISLNKESTHQLIFFTEKCDPLVSVLQYGKGELDICLLIGP
jgi:hypothetical protein